jgi:hypothetical protein
MDADKEDVAEEMPYYSKSKVLRPQPYNLYGEEHNKDTNSYSNGKVLQPRQYNLFEEEYNRDINPNYSDSRVLRPRQYYLFEEEENRDTKPYYAKVQDVKSVQERPRQQDAIKMQNSNKKEKNNSVLLPTPTEEENREILHGPPAEPTDGENREILLGPPAKPIDAEKRETQQRSKQQRTTKI